MRALRIRLAVAIAWLQCMACGVAPINRRALLRWVRHAVRPGIGLRYLATITGVTARRMRGDPK